MRIEIGDVQRPGHQRGGARTAHADRNALPARPFHEVRDDQEVAGKAHAVDDAELVVQPLVDRPSRSAARPCCARRRVRPCLGLRAQFLFGRAAGFRHEYRQDGIALLRAEGAAARDLERVLDRFGQIGELRRHFGRAS